MANGLLSKTLRPGQILGLDILIAPSAFAGSIGLIIVTTLLFTAWSGLSTGEAIIGGILAMLLWWISEMIHQYGHALAARRTGYPMTGVLLFLVLGQSLYPRDEPELPGPIHIRRALGGPIASFAVLLLSIIAALLIPASTSPLFNALAVYIVIINLLVFSVGAFLPLGFTDGSTLLRWWGKS